MKRLSVRTSAGLSRVYVKRLPAVVSLMIGMSLLFLPPTQLRAQPFLDGFDPGANAAPFAMAVQADGKILVGGTFTTLGGGHTGTTTRNYLGRLHPNGSLDLSFNPGVNNTVQALAVQADGKILVAGNFTTLGGGGTGTTTRNYLGRLNADGTLDTGFNPGANNWIVTLAVQPDGKILVGGFFTTLGGGGTGTTTRNGIGRLNPDGTLDASFNPGASGYVGALAVQRDGKILVGGGFTGLGGGTGTITRNRIGRLSIEGTLDPSFNPGANDSINALAVQADGKVLVGGQFTGLGGGTGTTTRNYLGRLHPDGSLDTSFNPGANFAVFSLAVQADGKILAGGSFSTLGGGGTGTTARHRIGRLHPDGSLDAPFVNSADSTVYALAVQADGKILVGGSFATLGFPRNRLGRLKPDSTLDTSFDPGANGVVDVLAVQADGKILVGGSFTTLGGGGTGTTTRNYLGRLHPDGTLDSSFNPGANGDVFALAVQADGKILVGGIFTTLGGGGTGTTARNYIGRLNTDGTLDASFDPGANARVQALAVQADGKILVAGFFTTLGGGGTGTTAHNRIGRLHPDGTLEASFNPGVNDYVAALGVQADGKILLSGNFIILVGSGSTDLTTRNRIGRLNSDGTLDTGFDPDADSTVRALALQADGKILLGGDFTTLGGNQRFNFGRLNPGGSIDTSFNPGAESTVYALAAQADGKVLLGGKFGTGREASIHAALQALTVQTNGTTINWSRSGASPEAALVTFELSTDAINYTALARPTRITGGWELTGQSLLTQQNIFIRARGFYPTGYSNSSGSIVETVRNAFISLPPLPTQVVSQKMHGAAAFGIDLPLTGSPGIECRSGGVNSDYRIVFTFPTAVTFTAAAVTSGTASVASSAGSGTATITVDLTGVTNAQRITVTLVGLSNGSNVGDLGVSMGVLIGDTNGNGSVTASDIGQTKAQSGQTVGPSNFRTDVTANGGSINTSDIGLVKSQSGTQLPP